MSARGAYVENEQGTTRKRAAVHGTRRGCLAINAGWCEYTLIRCFLRRDRRARLLIREKLSHSLQTFNDIVHGDAYGIDPGQISTDHAREMVFRAVDFAGKRPPHQLRKIGKPRRLYQNLRRTPAFRRRHEVS